MCFVIFLSSDQWKRDESFIWHSCLLYIMSLVELVEVFLCVIFCWLLEKQPSFRWLLTYTNLPVFHKQFLALKIRQKYSYICMWENLISKMRQHSYCRTVCACCKPACGSMRMMHTFFWCKAMHVCSLMVVKAECVFPLYISSTLGWPYFDLQKRQHLDQSWNTSLTLYLLKDIFNIFKMCLLYLVRKSS